MTKSSTAPRIVLVLIVAGVLTAAAVPGRYGVKEEQTLEETFTFSGASASNLVLIDNVNGSIRVTGHDGDEVRMIAHEVFHARSERAAAARKTLALEWLERTGDSTLGAYIGLRHLALQMDVDELAPLLASLDPSLAGTRYYDQLDDRLRTLRAVTVGATAPDFSGPTREGETVSLLSLRGDIVLVDFWASWCGPCRRQHPDLIALYEERRDEGFEILGVGLEFRREPWLEALDADRLPWLNVSDLTGFDMEAAQLFAIRALPANVLIDREGTIVAKNVHGEDLRRAVVETL